MPEMYMLTQNLTVGSTKECESACIRNCSCSAYSYSDGCSIRSGGLPNLKQLYVVDSNGIIIYIRLATSDLPRFIGCFDFVSKEALSDSSPIVVKMLEGFSMAVLHFVKRRGKDYFVHGMEKSYVIITIDHLLMGSYVHQLIHWPLQRIIDPTFIPIMKKPSKIRQNDPEVIVLDPSDAIQHVQNRQSMLQDVADLNLSESYDNSVNTFLNTIFFLKSIA
ncbi:hypothetical protein GIB67_024480 [Kingdonia uniflora]|uniref:Apple domain-containing protein n=1 Tax=Kingdonia uniflora TaxID=39325 RepID=A0A7J7LNP3_9MAGN|nr:hypothetical protein GIB67_024480 [Kingdonia uniflora]